MLPQLSSRLLIRMLPMSPLRLLLLPLLFSLAAGGCTSLSTSTSVKGVWKDPTYAGGPLRKIFVISLMKVQPGGASLSPEVLVANTALARMVLLLPGPNDVWSGSFRMPLSTPDGTPISIKTTVITLNASPSINARIAYAGGGTNLNVSAGDPETFEAVLRAAMSRDPKCRPEDIE